MAKIIRITHQSPGFLRDTFASAMDIASVAALSYRPSNFKITDGFKYWVIDQENQNIVHLEQIEDYYWARITRKGQDFMEIQFSYRYDKADRFANALAELIAARWPDEITVSHNYRFKPGDVVYAVDRQDGIVKTVIRDRWPNDGSLTCAGYLLETSITIDKSGYTVGGQTPCPEHLLFAVGDNIRTEIGFKIHFEKPGDILTAEMVRHLND